MFKCCSLKNVYSVISMKGVGQPHSAGMKHQRDIHALRALCKGYTAQLKGLKCDLVIISI